MMEEGASLTREQEEVESESMKEEYCSYWPLLTFNDQPKRLLHFHHQFQPSPLHNNFLKAVKWAPDGSCFLANSEDNSLWRFDLPGDAAQDTYGADSLNLDKDTFNAAVAIHEGESVYDYCWYPHMVLSGIISCLDFNPCDPGLLAAGSFNRTAALYNEGNAELLHVLHGHEGGITQVQFSKDGNYLYTGARKDPYILCWDLRYMSGIVYKLFRLTMETNQRISFDIEPYGRHLGSGGQDGHVSIYDLQTGVKVFDFQAAKDTVNGFRFHPYLPLAVSSSGHRRFDLCNEDGERIYLTGEENCASVWKFSCEWIKIMHASESCKDAGIIDNGDALEELEDR